MPIAASLLSTVQIEWRRRYDDYLTLSDYVRDRCFEFRRQHPNVVRIIFSREPKVKTAESITQKVEARRKETPGFSYEDVTDIVALTILCPYASDVSQFIAWMKTAFEVRTDDATAYKVYPSGHRGYHYIITPTLPELASKPRLNKLKCELQIKTLLQEAFDAKSHDLWYKPGNLKVGEDLQAQFTVVSVALNAIDGQTEFLKRLILREQQALDLRRNACLELYLRGYGDMPAKLGLDPDNLPEVVTIVQNLRRGATELLSGDFCKFAAYCALKIDNPLLTDEAIGHAEEWVQQDPQEVHRLFVRGAINWALGRFESSFQDLAEVIDRAARGEAADPEEGRRAKNNLIYFVCDCKLFRHSVDDDWVAKIGPFVEELRSADTGNETDTLGFYLILFGKTPDEIEEGRRLMRNSRTLRRNKTDAQIYAKFYTLHEYVALNRLLEMQDRP
jgi:ppGpp synthetase/RelA/SpoT-type nucleotidyltranferase